MSTGKERLQVLLQGGVPETPPHWELVFQIPREMFGIDLDMSWQNEAARPENVDRSRVLYLETAHRLVEECGWAAVPSLDPWDPNDLAWFRERFDRALVPGYENDGVFWMLPGGEMEEFALRLYEDMDGLQAEARAKCERAKEKLRRHADAGADFFVLTYDFGYNQAPFISPAHFGELCAPYLAELVALSHELEKKVILHSDGCIDSLLDTIVACGVDGYQSVDPQGGMDIRSVRRRYPDLILMGNVACSLLQERDEEAISAAVEECMAHGGVGKRYIFSTSNCIFAGMPPESYRLMLDRAKRYLEKRG